MSIHPLFSATLLLLPLLGIGCANTSLTRDRMLQHPELLRPAPEKLANVVPDEVEVYTHPAVPWDAYTGILVERPEFGLAADGHQPTPERSARLAEGYEKRLRDAFADRVELSETAGPGVMRLRSMVTGINPQNGFVNLLALIIALPVDMGGISAEFELTDSESNEVLFAMAARRDGTPFHILEAFHRYGHAGFGMKKWAKLLLDCVPEPAESVLVPDE